jgi:hypothetical protein
LKGDKGDQGIQGIQGFTGAQGTPGAQGFKGDPGDDGAPGATGAPGPPGATGAPGPQGAQGIQGVDGMRGSTWSSGFGNPPPEFLASPYIDFYLNRTNGNVHQEVGNSVALIMNIKGDPGATGPQGPQGLTGPAGTTDYNNLINKPNFTGWDTNAADDITSIVAGTGISVSGTGSSRTIASTVAQTTLGFGQINGGNYSLSTTPTVLSLASFNSSGSCLSRSGNTIVVAAGCNGMITIYTSFSESTSSAADGYYFAAKNGTPIGNKLRVYIEGNGFVSVPIVAGAFANEGDNFTIRAEASVGGRSTDIFAGNYSVHFINY